MNYELPFYRSLRFRLSFMIAVIICVITGVTAISTAARGFEREVAQKRELLSAAASGHAAAVTSPIIAQSPQDALFALRGIRNLPGVVQADIRLQNGDAFAQLGTGAVLIRDEEQGKDLSAVDLWGRSRLRVEVPILNNGEVLGHLSMLADLSDLRASVFQQLRVTVLIAFFAIMMGIALSYRMISRMTKPLHRLSVYMADFADDRAHDYEGISGGKDETGILAATFTDMVSSIKARDQKIAHHMETLEETIAERTRDLSDAKEAAEAANAAKSDFLATMSHEIRTPMNGMLVMADMLSSADLSARHRRYAEIIARSGGSLLTIINDILDMSKIESGKLELEKCAVCVDTLISDVTTLFWERAREQGVELTSYVSPDVPLEIIADPTRLNQIITNLVNNALKFTTAGSVQIRVCATTEEKGAMTRIVIDVQDTGIGIPEDKIETIFNTFSQADQSTTRRFGGTGLGLAVCRKLADAMGGKISVTSELEKGSTFSFELEVAVKKPAAPAKTHDIKFALDLGMTATADTLASLIEGYGGRSASDEADIRITTSQRILAGAGIANITQIILSDIGDTLAGDVLRSGQAADLLPNPFTRQDVQDLLQKVKVRAYRGGDALKISDASEAYPTFAGLRILAADDNAVNREILREALSTLGVHADFAENGAQALKMATSETYDAIFMDGAMPEMDGFEATCAIRAYQREHSTAPTPIIALTAQVAGTTQQAWEDAGAAHFIAKPFTLQRLAGVLSDLGHSQNRETAPSEVGEVSAQMPLLNMETIRDLESLGQSSGRDLRWRVWSMFRQKAPEGVSALVQLADEKGALVEISRQAHALKSMALSAGIERLANRCGQIEIAATQEKPWRDICLLITKLETDLDQSFSSMNGFETLDQSTAAQAG